MKKTYCALLICFMSLLSSGAPDRPAAYAKSLKLQSAVTSYGQPVITKGDWRSHANDLTYTVAFTSKEKPYGPLVVYRVPGADQRATVAIATIERETPFTPQLVPAPAGDQLALLTPARNGPNGAALGIVSTESGKQTTLLPQGVASAEAPVWSANSQTLYYHSGTQRSVLAGGPTKGGKRSSGAISDDSYDEIHSVDLQGHDQALLRRKADGASLRLIGLDHSGSLILTLARTGQPVALLRVAASENKQYSDQGHIIKILPADILPGNVLRISEDGTSVECERVSSWKPLQYAIERISLQSNSVTTMRPAQSIVQTGRVSGMLDSSKDGSLQVAARVTQVRSDLAAQGIPNVPAQEELQLTDQKTGASQQLTLPEGGQVVDTFWSKHVSTTSLKTVAPGRLASMLAQSASAEKGKNASPIQQEEWMFEAHAGRLKDGPKLPTMCYGDCPQGPTGDAHVSATIMHGVAYTESNWHQFNTKDYRINNQAIGSTVKSFDGGWGEFQQTWGMPPQCQKIKNCRSDVAKIQNSQSYNIGVGAQSLINAWNRTAGVGSKGVYNDPYKANHWFFAVWAYNGSYGNNPNDVPSSVYGHWYPGAPFRSIYQEYVWYYSAHPQQDTTGWTNNYAPGLGTALLPPQSAFAKTSDSFVTCITCTIADWTSGTYDREWVGMGMKAKDAANFRSAFNKGGGEDTLGLPRDNGAGAKARRWANGWVQEFAGGSASEGALMLADNITTAYWISGSVWQHYLKQDKGAGGCHGYPTSALTNYNDPDQDANSYKRQNFQNGFIVWDTAAKKVVSDSCQEAQVSSGKAKR